MSSFRISVRILVWIQSLLLWVASAAWAQGKEFASLYGRLGYAQTSNYFGASEQQVQSLQSYFWKEDPVYREVNGFLRYYPKPYEWYGTSPEDAKQIVEDIDAIFADVPELPEDLRLYRGMTLDWRANRSFDVGEEFVDAGFVSTSTSLSVVKHFAHGTGESSKKQARSATFTLYLNEPHAQGILIDQGEDEVLLPRSQRFRIMARRVKGNQDRYLVQICGFSSCSEKVKHTEVLKDWVR